MKSIVIADNKETITGFRLAGIEGRVLNSDEDFIKIVDELIADKNIGIIMIIQKFFMKYKNELLERKLAEDETLIVEIPGFNEGLKESLISEHIRDAIGLKL